jgi:hypothetical protein
LEKLKEKNPELDISEDGRCSEETLRKLKKKYGIREKKDPTDVARNEILVKNPFETPMNDSKLTILFKSPTTI